LGTTVLNYYKVIVSVFHFQ